MIEAKPCPACGTENPVEDWGACSEIRGTCWQSGSLECSNKDCFHSVSVSIDSDLYISDGESLLIKLWNEMANKKWKR